MRKVEGQSKTIVELIEVINKYTYAVQETGLYNKRIAKEHSDIKSKDANIENVLLYSKKGVSVRKQAALLGCSEKTIYNYRDKLRAQGRLDKQSNSLRGIQHEDKRRICAEDVRAV